MVETVEKLSYYVPTAHSTIYISCLPACVPFELICSCFTVCTVQSGPPSLQSVMGSSPTQGSSIFLNKRLS